MKVENKNIVSVERGIIVHGCNALGVMGAGVALALKKKDSRIFTEYKNSLNQLTVDGIDPLGSISIVELNEELIVVNGITQRTVSFNPKIRNVDYDAIKVVFAQVAELGKATNLPIYYPKIGAGLGGGDWRVIEEIIKEELDGLDHTLCIV